MEEMVAKSIPCLVLSCLQHTDAHFYFRNELTNLRESDMFESISDTVMHFYIAYDAEYKRIIEKIFKDPYFMKSKSRFLDKIRSRCLIMCESPTFFNFVLMCAFVGHVASFCYEIGKCYRVVENACKCAVAVFQRKFLELFNREGGLEGLWTYSNYLNETVLDKQDECKDLKDILTPDPRGKEFVLSLLNDCEEADFGEYYLTRFERKLLYNVTKKKLKKLKSGLDCLMYHIPRKYFQTLNCDSRNIVFKVSGSNVVAKKLNQRAECSLCSSPIKGKMKKYYEPSISSIVEKQSEPPDCAILTKHSAASNVFIDRKAFESPNNNFSDSSSEYTIPERSLPLVYCRMSQEEQCSTSYERSSQEPESANEFSRIPKLNFDEDLKLESQKQKDAVRRHPFFPFETSPEKDVATFLGNLEISTSPKDKCLHFFPFETPPERDVTFLKKPEILTSPHGESSLATHFNLSLNELVPPNLYTDQKAIQRPLSFSSFKDETSDAERCQLEMKTESSKNYSIPSDVNNSRSYASTNYGTYIPFHFGTEAKTSLGMTDFFPNTHDNIFHSVQNQSSARFCQDESFTTTHSKMAPAIDSTDHQGKKNRVSLSKEFSLLAIQHSSDGYLASESNISDNKHVSGNEESNISGNEEFQSKSSLLHTPALICLDNSSTERQDSESETTTSKPLTSPKCFHCGKQSPTKFCQCKLSFTATPSAFIATVNDSSDHPGSGQNQISSFSLSSKSPSIQHISDGYFASDSNVSDFNGNEEFHTELFPLQISTFTNLENAPSEREYYYIDWEGDTTLNSLMNHKCFHCGTKCFNYIIYAFQQFSSHFLE